MAMAQYVLLAVVNVVFCWAVSQLPEYGPKDFPTRAMVIVSIVIFNFLINSLLFWHLLNMIRSTSFGADRLLTLPPLKISQMLKFYALSWGTSVVYFLPVLTIPLLPVALLSLAHVRGLGAFDVVAIGRQAFKQAGINTAAWLQILFWITFPAAVCTGISFGIVYLRFQLPQDLASWVLYTGMALTFALCVVPICLGVFAQARCIGLMGRIVPGLVGSLHASRVRGAICLAVGAVILLLACYFSLKYHWPPLRYPLSRPYTW